MITTEGNEVVQVDNACTLGTHKLMGAWKNRLKNPIMRDGGGWRDASYEEAIEYAAGVLLDADRPLLYGWSSTQGEAQGLGVSMAELLGGVIDSTTSVCHGPSILAIQEVGHPGCTLGQVKNRADLVIYWACNPTEAHPRHMSRYTTYAHGFFLENAFREQETHIR